MNRNITLILSAVLVFVLLGIWLYLMFFSDRTNNGQGPIEGSGEFTEFDNLGNNVPDGGGQQGEGSGTGEGGDIYDPAILRQLTTRNVIGHKEVVIASTTHIVYMEAGVGHIYGINLENGREERFSAVTIPDARAAVFSSDGLLAAVKTGDDTGVNPLSLAAIDYTEAELSIQEIEPAVAQFTFTEDNLVLYAVVENSKSVVRAYNPALETTTTVFETPFREATISFGDNSDNSHFFYPKTSHLLEGFVYEVDGNSLTRLPIDGYGLTSVALGDSLLTSYRYGSTITTSEYNYDTNTFEDIDLNLIPEKCLTVVERIYCAVPSQELFHSSVDKWNQGVSNFSDNLWSISSSSEKLIDITEFSGRKVDVINGLMGGTSGDWYFQNKLDNTLWIYELSRITELFESEEEDETTEELVETNETEV